MSLIYKTISYFTYRIKIHFHLFKKHYCGQDIKRCSSGVQLDNIKVLRVPGPRTKYFEPNFVVQ